MAETVHVVLGTFEMVIAGEQTIMASGDTAHVPADVFHAGENVGSARGRRIVIFTPGGMEDFFLEIGAASADVEADRGAALAASTRHGWRFLNSADDPPRGR